jgi:DNA processing protein
LSPVAPAPKQAPSTPGLAPDAVVRREELDLETAAVLDALPSRGGMGSTRIARRAGLDPATVVRCLGALAAGGFAERCEAGWRLRRTR